MSDDHRLLIVDLSVNPAIYRPVDHWRRHVEALGVPVDVCRPPDGDVPADLALYSHAILTGSEASILADTEWIVRACELTRALDARKVRLLGSCFGHQMLARALSGLAFVRRTPTPEFGWVEVRKTGSGARDPLTAALPDRCHVYTSHFDEVWPLPPGWRVWPRPPTARAPSSDARRAAHGAFSPIRRSASTRASPCRPRISTRCRSGRTCWRPGGTPNPAMTESRPLWSRDSWMPDRGRLTFPGATARASGRPRCAA